MPIRKDGRLEPFSHRPGVQMVLPGTTLLFEIYPTLLVCGDGERIEIPVGRVTAFTAQLDLERGRIRVWGEGAHGTFRYAILPAEGGYKLVVERGDFDLPSRGGATVAAPGCERLSLGLHKKLDWELVERRGDMAEIFPVWMRLGQMVPEVGDLVLDGANLAPLFRSYFSTLMAPRAVDIDHWGGVPLSIESSALQLLTAGAKAIRALFIKTQGDEIQLLPNLLTPFHCGRFLGAEMAWGAVDFEWSKKRLRRVILRPKRDGEVVIRPQKGLEEFRLNGGALHRAGQPVTLRANQSITLDRFHA